MLQLLISATASNLASPDTCLYYVWIIQGLLTRTKSVDKARAEHDLSSILTPITIFIAWWLAEKIS